MSGALGALSEFRTPALLEAAVDAETALGGRVRTWTPITTLWIALTAPALRLAEGQDLPPDRIETAQAVARLDLRAAPGQRLTVAGQAPWTVQAVRPADPAPGRMTLLLQRVS